MSGPVLPHASPPRGCRPVHSHQETFPDLGLFILIQLPARGVMFRLRRKRTTLSLHSPPRERSKPIGVELRVCALRHKRTARSPETGQRAGCYRYGSTTHCGFELIDDRLRDTTALVHLLATRLGP